MSYHVAYENLDDAALAINGFTSNMYKTKKEACK